MLTQKSMNINGVYIEDLIDGYTTTNVSGREMIDVEHDTTTIGHSDGSVYKGKRYPSRTLTVSFVIEGGERSILSEKLDKLNNILDTENATIIFRDEPDRYYVGTRSGDANATITLGVVIGSFEIFCPDPFKYSVEEYEVEAVATAETDEEGNIVTGHSFVVEYNGNYKSFPKLEASFYSESETTENGESEVELTGDGDCGYVAFFNEDEKIIQLGDPDEVDGEDLPKSQTLVNQAFKKSNSWGTAVKKLWPLNNGKTVQSTMVQTGGLVMTSSPMTVSSREYYLNPSDYKGNASGLGSVWHGPTITRTIPKDANDEIGADYFTFSYAQKFAIGSNTTTGQKQRGLFEALLVNTSNSVRKIVAGVRIYKGVAGKNGKLYFYVNGKNVYSRDIDLSYNNQYFGNNRAENKAKKISAVNSIKTSTIQKYGNKVTFNVAGIKKVITCSDNGFADMLVHEITFGFGTYGTYEPVTFNGIYCAKFVKARCATWRETPNKFTTDDVVVADCRTGKIFLNDSPEPQYGALGNDWEEFYLKPGTNRIGIAYSDWVSDPYAPIFKMRYREVFL